MSYKSDKSYIREIFDDVSLSLINFLESHEGVTNVQFFEIGGCKQKDFITWDRVNKPYKLPEDLKAFFSISDGLLLRWSVSLNNQSVQLGYIHLNSLEAVTKNVDTPFEEESNKKAVFFLDTSPHGNVCFVYNRKKNQFSNPKIYFQDVSCKYHYICDNFTEYYRLMIMYMGIPNWQYIFTDIGCDNTTRTWINFFCPERITNLKNISSVEELEEDEETEKGKRKKKKNKINFKKLDEFFKKQTEIKRHQREKTDKKEKPKRKLYR